MSVELSHRLAWIAHQPPIIDLTWPERHALWLACERAEQFSDLSDNHQQLILHAEAARARAIAQKRLSAAG